MPREAARAATGARVCKAAWVVWHAQAEIANCDARGKDRVVVLVKVRKVVLFVIQRPHGVVDIVCLAGRRFLAGGRGGSRRIHVLQGEDRE